MNQNHIPLKVSTNFDYIASVAMHTETRNAAKMLAAVAIVAVVAVVVAVGAMKCQASTSTHGFATRRPPGGRAIAASCEEFQHRASRRSLPVRNV